MVRLAPMQQAEFQAYLESAIKDYAQDKIDAGAWSAERALELSAQSYHELLPSGLASANQHIFTLVDGAQSASVGMLWFAVTDSDAGPNAFVYDFLIYEEFRRRGYGSQALEALDAKVRELGVDTIALHVFGHNHAARSLYEKMGYEITDISMAKRVRG